MTIRWTYEYSPFTSQQGREIPAFEIFDHKSRTVLMTNENHSRIEQEKVAGLAIKAPALASLSERIILCWNNYNHPDLTVESNLWQNALGQAIRELATLLDKPVEAHHEVR